MAELQKNAVVMEMCETDNRFTYKSSIDTALAEAQDELEHIDESLESLAALKPQCDKIDYALAASSGALCGIIDIFLVGAPLDSPLGNVTDKWFANRTCDFARLCGWKNKNNIGLKSAIDFLEDKFKIPYDQTHLGEAAKIVFGLDTKLNTFNHHFASLGHHPSLLGLVFSIYDQFNNRSHFILDGQLIQLMEADNKFKLQGTNFCSKLWCGFVNWLGHIMSDVSGSYSCKNRGTGIPSPLWDWINSVIVIKAKLHIPASQFDKDLNKMAMELFKNGFDARFQTTQTIPVLINELIVRLFYSIRRFLKYYKETKSADRTFYELWKYCKPFGNPTIGRMLTVAHGTFCLIDISDATIRAFVAGGGSFNPKVFLLRLNIAGVARFSISIFGETKRAIRYHRALNKANKANEEQKALVTDYIAGLNILKAKYNDAQYLSFVDDLSNNDYIIAFTKTSKLAELRGVPQEEILKSKADIDAYFQK
jgi:hypothetical protein